MSEPITPDEVVSPGGFLKPAVYDKLKQLALVGLPALATFYITLGTLWGFPAVEQVVGTIVALDTLLGTLLGVSKKRYDASDAKYGGVIQVIPTENGGTRFELEVLDDLDKFESSKEITFKVDQGPQDEFKL